MAATSPINNGETGDEAGVEQSVSRLARILIVLVLPNKKVFPRVRPAHRDSKVRFPFRRFMDSVNKSSE
jgi:hypothetical protein